LCRVRAELVTDRTRARHRLSRFLLRHGRVRRGGATTSTLAHQRRLLGSSWTNRPRLLGLLIIHQSDQTGLKTSGCVWD
jgi:hypothetical protein